MVRDPCFDAASAVIGEGLEARAFPAASVNVGRSSGPVWQEGFGRLSYDEGAQSCDTSSIFDLASLTKVIAAVPIAMRQIRAGTLALDTKVSDVFESCTHASTRPITVRHLLDHSSGLPSHVRLWEQASGREAFRKLICQVPLERQPGTASVYSDTGFVLLGLLLEATGTSHLDRQLNEILGEWPEPLMFHPPRELAYRIAPTEKDPWRGHMLRGEVHDENAAAIGGVAAHAGLFGTAEAVGAFARLVLRTYQEPTALGTPDQMKLFATPTGVPGSSRALGWDTALPTSSCGTRMSAGAIGHTGFTGTSLWIDPARDLYAVLLTNRVHPTRRNEKLLPLRARFHDALPF
jgi:serine-type D-Ala-D-Ala carboxypeptidase